jgi:hypothetical protein
MSTKRFGPAILIAFVLCLGAKFDSSGASGAQADKDRIGTLEQEVATRRRELAELREMVANERMWDRIRGTWRQHLHIRSGKPVLDGPFANDVDVVWSLHPTEADQQNFLPEPDVWILGSMSLDATKDPVWVDFTKREFGTVRVIPGILKVETERDRRLQSIVRVERQRVSIALRRDARCTPNESGVYDERPTSFESTEDNGVTVFVLEPYKWTGQLRAGRAD